MSIWMFPLNGRQNVVQVAAVLCTLLCCTEKYSARRQEATNLTSPLLSSPYFAIHLWGEDGMRSSTIQYYIFNTNYWCHESVHFWKRCLVLHLLCTVSTIFIIIKIFTELVSVSVRTPQWELRPRDQSGGLLLCHQPGCCCLATSWRWSVQFSAALTSDNTQR